MARPVGNIERLGRWAKRNRGLATASMLALAALLLMTVGGIYSYITINRSNIQLADSLEKQKELTKKSNESLGNSVSAIRDFYIRFGEASFLAETEVGMGFRNKMLDEGVAYLQSFIESNETNPELQLELGSAFDALADLYFKKRKFKEQGEFVDKAIEILEPLYDSNPGDLQVASRYGGILIVKAERTNAFQGFEEARPFFDQAAIVTRLIPGAVRDGVEEVDGGDAAKHFMATIVKNRKLYNTGQQNQARDDAQKELLELEEFTLEFPEDAVLQMRMAQAANWVGILHAKSEDLESAARCFEKCRRFALNANAIEPRDDYLTHAAYGSGNLIPLLVQINRNTDSETNIEKILKIQKETVSEFKTLAERNPNGFLRQLEYANSLNNLGTIMADEGLEDALQYIEQSDQFLDTLFLRNPKDTETSNWLALATARTLNLGARATFWGCQGDYAKQQHWIECRMKFDEETFELKPNDFALKIELTRFLDRQIELLFAAKEFDRGFELLAKKLNFQNDILDGSDQTLAMAQKLLQQMNGLGDDRQREKWPSSFSRSFVQTVAMYEEKLASLAPEMQRELVDVIDKLQQLAKTK